MKKIKLLKALAFPVSAWFAFTVGSTVIHAQEQTVQPETVELQDMNEDDLSTLVEEKEIEDGTYTITSAVDENKSLDAYGAGTSNGTNVDTYDANGSNAQYWSILTNEDGSKTIQNLNSGQVLDVAGGQGGNGNNVQLYDANGTNAQKWRIVNNGDGYYTIQSMINTGYVIDLAGASKDNGANVQIYQQNQSLAQLWKFTFVSKLGNIKTEELKKLEGKINISSATNSNYVVDVSGASTSNGANINLYGDNQSRAQVWNLSIDSEGYATFTNDKTNSVLDLNAGAVVNGSNIQLYENNGSKAQKWILIRNGSSYEIRSALNLRYGLDIYAGSISKGTNIQLYQMNGSNAQKWLLTPFVSTYDLGGISEEELNNLPKITYIQSSKDNNYVLDVNGGTFNNSENVQLYGSNGTDAQAWKITHNEYGYVTIYNYNSEKVLDIAGASFTNGTNIQQYESNSSIAQLWYIEKTKDGYVIRSRKNPNFVLDLNAGTTQNGQNIQLYTYNDSLAQKWIFTKFTPSYGLSYKVNQSAIGYGKGYDGAIAGSSNGNPIQTILINLGTVDYDGNLKYQVSTKENGWTDWAYSGSILGNTGCSIEAFKVLLEGDLSNYYNVTYRSWIDDFGWLNWANNGNSSGTDNNGRDISAICIRLVKKGDSSSNTSLVFVDNNRGYYADGLAVSGAQTLDGKYIPFTSDGYLYNGILWIDGVEYTYENGFVYKTYNPVAYYSQRDSRWSGTVIGGYQFDGTGCCISVLTSIVNKLLNTNYIPTDIGQIVHNAGYFNAGGAGTNGAGVVYVCNYFGLSYKNNLSLEAMKSELLAGHLVTAALGYNVPLCPWYGVTHEVLLYGYDSKSGITYVNDPYNAANNGEYGLDFIYNHPSFDGGDLMNGGPFFSIYKA